VRFIGIDQSISNTGIVILDDGGNVERTIRVSFSKYKGGRRFLEIYKYFYELSQEYGNDCFFALEDYAFNSKFSREKMGELRGIIELALLHNNSNIAIMPIKIHRKITVHNGNASKQKAILLIQKLHHQHFKTSDEYDAFSIAIALYHMMVVKTLDSNMLLKIKRNW
jgi:Holliday junction resolvasome RuvABC endonuclease subunit